MATRGLAAWKEPCSSEFLTLTLCHGLFRRMGQKPASGNHFRTRIWLQSVLVKGMWPGWPSAVFLVSLLEF